MVHFRKVVNSFIFITLFAGGISGPPAWANGEHGNGHHAEKHNMGMGGEKHMDHPEKEKSDGHHRHTIKKEAKPEFPPGTEEVIIDLSGPFCSRHPEEISTALKKLDGVLDVEAFNRRDYVLIHFTPEKVAPNAMAEIINSTKGSGWRCKGTVSTRRRTER